jgi:hypothetical protein
VKRSHRHNSALKRWNDDSAEHLGKCGGLALGVIPVDSLIIALLLTLMACRNRFIVDAM